jgi:hypothetical protein
MVDINVESDLEAIRRQIETLGEELRKVELARENLAQQITNLNGVAMYLRGKIATDDTDVEVVEEEDLERSVETPEE